MKKLRVTIEGKVYEVLVEIIDEPAKSAGPTLPAVTPLPEATPASVGSATATATAAKPVAKANGVGDVASPLAGKIVSIDVKVGQAVEEGAQVATVEAMKMNTYIFAPKTGRVESIYASAGDGVEEGTVLLRIG